MSQSIQRFVVGQVQLQGRERDIARVQRADVCAFFVHTSGRFAADPVLGTPSRVYAPVEHIAIDA